MSDQVSDAMRTIRRTSYAAFAVACLHLVFGAIVRISGSGMGCGPHWPKCYGYWVPPMSRPDLVIEVTHRYLASFLLLSLITLLVVTWRRRGTAGVRGRGGALRSATLAVSLGFGAALLGAVTVKFGNAPLATLAHWTVAMSLVATVAATVIRSGGLGGATAQLGGGSRKTMRGAIAGAGLALAAVVLGGLTAKYPGASVACQAFPSCGRNPDVARAAVEVQLLHRTLAVLVVLHLVGLTIGVHKRREAAVIRRAVSVALSLGVLQLVVAGAMVLLRLPPVLRSLHEATGVSIWIATFVLAVLARLAAEPGRNSARVDAPVPGPAEPIAGSPQRRRDAEASDHALLPAGQPVTNGGDVFGVIADKTPNSLSFFTGATTPLDNDDAPLRLCVSAVNKHKRPTMAHSVAVIVARGADL